MPIKQAGFTLIECLIALPLLAIVAVVAAMGLQHLLHIKSGLEKRQEQWSHLNMTFARMQSDLQQAMPRAVRDVSGGLEQPFIISKNGFVLTRYTHNQSAAAISSMQRVAYVLQDQRLSRLTWLHLDRTHNTPQINETLLSHVQQFQVQIIDQHGQLQSSWQPQNNSDMQSAEYLFPVLPRGLQLSISTPLGKFKRIFTMAASYNQRSGGSV